MSPKQIRISAASCSPVFGASLHRPGYNDGNNQHTAWNGVLRPRTLFHQRAARTGAGAAVRPETCKDDADVRTLTAPGQRSHFLRLLVKLSLPKLLSMSGAPGCTKCFVDINRKIAGWGNCRRSNMKTQDGMRRFGMARCRCQKVLPTTTTTTVQTTTTTSTPWLSNLTCGEARVRALAKNRVWVFQSLCRCPKRNVVRCRQRDGEQHKKTTGSFQSG